ncbi:nucleotidyltransferase [bacterium]|nr:nucleotidyltransferase [bacterium]
MFEQLLAKIAKVLTAESVPYMVIGGQAVLVYGEPRITKDIDITLGLPPFEPDKLLPVVEKLGFKILVENPISFLEQTFVLPVADISSGIRIDFICSLSEYEKIAIARAKTVTIGNTQVKFISLEDLIIHKTIAGRQRDLDDIRTILLKHPSYDDQYVTEWLSLHDQELATDYEERLKQLKRSLRS